MNESQSHTFRKTPPVYKVIILGESNVGKSSLFLRYTEDRFREAMNNTIGINNIFKEIYIDGNPLHLQMWDTAGQERFKSIVSAFYRESDGFVFVYDVSIPRSFEYMEGLINEMADIVDPMFTVIVGNKTDTLSKTELANEEHRLSAFAKKRKYMFYLASAKTGEKVNKAFDELSRALFYNKVKRERKLNRVDITKKKRKWYKWC